MEPTGADWGVSSQVGETMRLRAMLAVAVLVPCLIVGGGAAAKQYEGVTAQDVAAILAAKGIEYKVLSDGSFKIAGGPVVVVSSCQADGRCNDIGFLIVFNNVKPPLDAVNKWNQTKKIPKASIDNDGFLNLDFWIEGVGLTDENFLESLKWFEETLKDDFWGPYVVRTSGT